MVESESERNRPRLVLLRATRSDVSGFLVGHVSEQERCLRQDFDVTTINADCDYDEVCDRVQPAVAVFECGVDSVPLHITNIHSQSAVPKVGFLHSDAFDPSRAVFVAYMEQWGVSTYFTHSVAMGEYLPELAGSLFYWPNFIDPTVFRRRSQPPNVPVLITGSHESFYPWRNRVTPEIYGRVPALMCPHPGWRSGPRVPAITYVGDRYVELLAMSRIIPTCGSMSKDVVRKHLEIPAVGACLLTEDTASIRAAGFVDEVNCVFVDSHDVVDKIEHLLTHEGELAAIIDAGHTLVQARHTMDQRHQIAEWLRAYRSLSPGQTIVQDGPFSSIEVSKDPLAKPTRAVISGGVDRRLVADGWSRLAAGQARAAGQHFRRALNYAYVPEAVVGLCWSLLTEGDAGEARTMLENLLAASMVRFSAPAPDPVQWAVWIRVLLCAGDVESARQALHEYAQLEHEQLRRLAAILAPETAMTAPHPVGDRPTINPLPSRSEAQWLVELDQMLTACGQSELAAKLLPERDGQLSKGVAAGSNPGPGRSLLRRSKVSAIGAVGRSVARLRSLGPDWLVERIGTRLEVDGQFRHVVEAVAREPGRALLVVGAPRRDRWAYSLRRAARRNPSIAAVVTMSRFDSAAGSGQLAESFVYLTAAALDASSDPTSLLASRLIVFNGTSLPHGSEFVSSLRAAGRFELAASDPQLGNGLIAVRNSRAISFENGPVK